jgi:hypothetical protein
VAILDEESDVFSGRCSQGSPRAVKVLIAIYAPVVRRVDMVIVLTHPEALSERPSIGMSASGPARAIRSATAALTARAAKYYLGMSGSKLDRWPNTERDGVLPAGVLDRYSMRTVRPGT